MLCPSPKLPSPEPFWGRELQHRRALGAHSIQGYQLRFGEQFLNRDLRKCSCDGFVNMHRAADPSLHWAKFASQIQSWGLAVTEMPNCWGMPGGGGSPIPLLRHRSILSPCKGQERSRGQGNQKESSRNKFVADVCGMLCMGKDSPWESCPVSQGPGESCCCCWCFPPWSPSGDGESWAHSKACSGSGIHRTLPTLTLLINPEQMRKLRCSRFGTLSGLVMPWEG